MQSMMESAPNEPSTPTSGVRVVPITTGVHVSMMNRQDDEMEKGETQHPQAAMSQAVPQRRRMLVLASFVVIVAVAGVLIGVVFTRVKNRTLTASSSTTESGEKVHGCCEQDCNEDAYYCKYPIGDCGATPSDAECVELPQVCIERLYDPVCGCDSVTYGNECDASAAGVSILSEGACPGDEVVECEGNEDCSDDEFCKLSSCQGKGTCLQRPEECPEDDDSPVCGCDGETHDSTCSAELAGVSILAEAACPEVLSVVECTDNRDCIEDEFCMFKLGACDADSSAGGFGECTVIPEVCTDEFNEVCGCDGSTYSNECEALAVGVSILEQGECRDPDMTTACESNEDCLEDFHFCKFPEGECGDSGQGECVQRPEMCTMDWRPVCGCDSTTTYGNACAAAVAGASVLYQGECSSNRDDVDTPLPSCSECDSGECILIFSQGDCGLSDEGECQDRPDACGRIDDPICGCDGNTYFNECEARKEGVSVATAGECP